MTRRLLLPSIALELVACRAQRDEFCNKVFECDLNAAEDPCDTSCRGRPMTCYAGSQLGGANFCAEACDPAKGSDDPSFTCTTSGALLRICHPHAEATDPSKGCPAGLQCYRTDLVTDDGVCMAMHVCATDDDCAGGQRNICAATIVNQLYPGLTTADHLQCLQRSCASSRSQCLAGESCLADYYEVGSAPDICVPNCEKLHCPPNFACVAATSGAASPVICVPGVPGERCVSDQDCLIGSCFDTGAGFNECVPPISCRSDLDCAVFGSAISTWVCAMNAATGQGACLSTTPFHGANCNETADAPTGHCPDGQNCYRYSPYNPAEAYGECRVPCDGAHRCPAIGGISHVCLADGAGGCYPSAFALPCTTAADCLAEFACLPVSPDERTVITSPTICTFACATDDDCRMSSLIRTSGFCKEGLCRLGGPVGIVCDRDEECREGVCRLDQSGQRLCAL